MPVNTCNSMGAFTKLIVQGGAKPRTFDASSERLGIVMESITRIQPFQGRRRITGNLGQHISAIRPHSYLVSGVLVAQVGPEDLHRWLPRAMWTNPLTNTGVDTYNLGIDSNPYEIDILIDRENAIFRYTDMRVARLVLRSSTEGGQQPQNEELLEMMVYFYAIEEQVDAEAWPSPEPPLVLGAQFSPYAHWEGKLYLDGTELTGNDTCYRNIMMSIDNRLQPSFYNGLSPKCFRSAGRVISLGFDANFVPTTIDDAEGLLSTAGEAVWLFTHTGGAMSTRFHFPAVRNNYRTPTIRGKGEIPLQFQLEAFETDTDQELEVLNDHAP